MNDPWIIPQQSYFIFFLFVGRDKIVAKENLNFKRSLKEADSMKSSLQTQASSTKRFSRLSISSQIGDKRISIITHDLAEINQSTRGTTISEQNFILMDRFRETDGFSDIILETNASEQSEEEIPIQYVIDELQYENKNSFHEKLSNIDNKSHTKNKKKNKLIRIDETKVKTELCKNWSESGRCNYSKKCKFAHGKVELIVRDKQDDNNKYRSKLCTPFLNNNWCQYGYRCQFIHENRSVDEIKSQFTYQSYLNQSGFSFDSQQQGYSIPRCNTLQQLESSRGSFFDDVKKATKAKSSKSVQRDILQRWVSYSKKGVLLIMNQISSDESIKSEEEIYRSN